MNIETKEEGGSRAVFLCHFFSYMISFDSFSASSFPRNPPIYALFCNHSRICYTSGGRTIAEKARWGYEKSVFQFQLDGEILRRGFGTGYKV